MVVGSLAKIRLMVLCRRDGHGCYIASVPMKRLVELSGYDKLRWSFVDGVLVLEGF